VEAYLKAQENVRIHDTLPRLRPGDSTVLFSPWSVDNESLARGLEVLIRQEAGPVAATAGYTWSRVDIDPPDQPAQPAPWDRRHQITTRLEAALGAWSGGLTGTYATGVPSDYAQLLPDEPDRLGGTARLDASLQYERAVRDVQIRARVAIYNLTGRNNPWYRTPVSYLTREDGFRSPLVTEFAVVDVYDLGRQPSFALTVTF
jgi:outer membrane cobalamin receptor